MVNYFEEHHQFERSRSTKRRAHNNNNLPFENKLASQDNSILNQTFHLDTNKQERIRQFCIEDAINGFLPRARSSGPRNSMIRNNDDNVRRVRSETASLFSSTCKLPLLDGTASVEKKTCTIRPWSRTQDELRKFKETLKSSATTTSSSS